MNRTHVTLRAANVIRCTAPPLLNAGTCTLEPSENVNVPPSTWSTVFGRSARSTSSNAVAFAHPSWIHVPARPDGATHSAVGASGYPLTTPSTAFTAV